MKKSAESRINIGASSAGYPLSSVACIIRFNAANTRSSNSRLAVRNFGEHRSSPTSEMANRIFERIITRSRNLRQGRDASQSANADSINSVEPREFRFCNQPPATHLPGVEVTRFVHTKPLVIVMHRNPYQVSVGDFVQRRDGGFGFL